MGSHLRCLLVGKSGAGKSSLCNIHSGLGAGDRDFRTICHGEAGDTTAALVPGRGNTALIDTGGFPGDRENNKENIAKMVEAVVEFKPHVVIFVVRWNGRIQDDDLANQAALMRSTFAGVLPNQIALILTGFSLDKVDGDEDVFGKAFFSYLEAFFEPFECALPLCTYIDKPHKAEDFERLAELMKKLKNAAAIITRDQVNTWDQVLEKQRSAVELANKNREMVLGVVSSRQLRAKYEGKLAKFNNGDVWTNGLTAYGAILVFTEPISGCTVNFVTACMRARNARKRAKLEQKVNSIMIPDGPQPSVEEMERLCNQESEKLRVFQDLKNTFHLM